MAGRPSKPLTFETLATHNITHRPHPGARNSPTSSQQKGDKIPKLPPKLSNLIKDLKDKSPLSQERLERPTARSEYGDRDSDSNDRIDVWDDVWERIRNSEPLQRNRVEPSQVKEAEALPELTESQDRPGPSRPELTESQDRPGPSRPELTESQNLPEPSTPELTASQQYERTREVFKEEFRRHSIDIHASMTEKGFEDIREWLKKEDTQYLTALQAKDVERRASVIESMPATEVEGGAGLPPNQTSELTGNPEGIPNPNPAAALRRSSSGDEVPPVENIPRPVENIPREELPIVAIDELPIVAIDELPIVAIDELPIVAIDELNIVPGVNEIDFAFTHNFYVRTCDRQMSSFGVQVRTSSDRGSLQKPRLLIVFDTRMTTHRPMADGKGFGQKLEICYRDCGLQCEVGKISPAQGKAYHYQRGALSLPVFKGRLGSDGFIKLPKVSIQSYVLHVEDQNWKVGLGVEPHNSGIGVEPLRLSFQILDNSDVHFLVNIISNRKAIYQKVAPVFNAYSPTQEVPPLNQNIDETVYQGIELVNPPGQPVQNRVPIVGSIILLSLVAVAYAAFSLPRFKRLKSSIIDTVFGRKGSSPIKKEE